MGNNRRLASKPYSILVDSSEFHCPEPICHSPIRKSPRTFDTGSVGLGIVAAMSDSVRRPSKPMSSTRSNPIPIASPGPESTEIKRPVWGDEEDEEMELSESYTCVISHVGGSSVTKRVYFDDGTGGNYDDEPEVFSESPPAEFFTRCCVCPKRLHRMSIFMHRGDKALCGVECRCQQMLSDELRENQGPVALKKPFDCSVSPCSASRLFSAGVVAA